MNWIHAKVTSAPLVVPNHTARRGVRSIWDDENPIASEPPILPPIEGGAPEDTESADQGAFNPETGEINWDCPCLGGMAHGPCGMEFRAAFSCFVYSEAEPKGMECVEKFKTMQDCFREHPDVYGEGNKCVQVSRLRYLIFAWSSH